MVITKFNGKEDSFDYVWKRSEKYEKGKTICNFFREKKEIVIKSSSEI